jgi:hypothetical protein
MLVILPHSRHGSFLLNSQSMNGVHWYGVACGARGGNCSLAAHATSVNTSTSIWYRAVTYSMDDLFRIENFATMPGVTPVIWATITTTLSALWYIDAVIFTDMQLGRLTTHILCDEIGGRMICNMR